MKNLFYLLVIVLSFSACQTSTDEIVEADPMNFKGSFLIEGENVLSTENPTMLSDYAAHLNIERTQIQKVAPTDVKVTVKEEVLDSILFNGFELKVSAKDLDTLMVAQTETVKSEVNEFPIKAKENVDVLPYFQADNFQWHLVVELEEDYEEAIPFRLTMNFNVKHSIR